MSNSPRRSSLTLTWVETEGTNSTSPTVKTRQEFIRDAASKMSDAGQRARRWTDWNEATLMAKRAVEEYVLRQHLEPLVERMRHATAQLKKTAGRMVN